MKQLTITCDQCGGDIAGREHYAVHCVPSNYLKAVMVERTHWEFCTKACIEGFFKPKPERYYPEGE